MSHRFSEFVTSSDLDEVERIPTPVKGFPDPDGISRRFSDPRQFTDYWRSLTGFRWYSRPMFWLFGVTETVLAPDIFKIQGVVYRFKLNMWTLFFPYVQIIRWVLEAGNGYPNTPRVSKIVVKYGDEWRMFNGEWQGYDETNLSWID